MQSWLLVLQLVTLPLVLINLWVSVRVMRHQQKWLGDRFQIMFQPRSAPTSRPSSPLTRAR